MISSEKMQQIASKMGFTFTDYVGTLEQERKKVLMFQRELPLCLELVTQAIDCCRQQLSGTTMEYVHGGQSDSSEHTSSRLGPVLEEFIPINRIGSSGFQHKNNKETINADIENLGQSDWLRSAQLWNQASDTHLTQAPLEKTTVVEVKRNGGAFQPFQREKTVTKTDRSPARGGASSSSAPAATSSSTAETTSVGGGSSRREEKEELNQRKQRRCWSPELHRRFLNALQQLGGSHVATPKQIRELMKVDGLTNDEVKSHLQKYRLHTRRPTPAIHSTDSPAPPQFLVVGGIWVPEYASSPGEQIGVPATTGIYAPMVAAAPATVTQSPANKVERPKPKVCRGGAVAGQCNSTATSSSSKSSPTSTISPVS